MAYSADLRVRYIRAVRAGRSARSQAKLFQIGASTGVKWMQAYRADGRTQAKSYGGGRRSPLAAHQEWFEKRLADDPDITLKEMCVELSDLGIATSKSAVSRFLLGLGFSFKKNRVRQRAREAGRCDGARGLA